MSSIDTERLLAPISASEPSGPNLEYDPGFADLERAAQGKPERQMGDSIVSGEPPEWKLVSERAASLLERTKDLRVASYLVLASIHRSGFDGLSAGLGLIRGLLEGFWPSLHPELDPDDGNDPTMRVTALAAVCTPQIISALRAAPLFRSRALGALSLRDLLAGTADGPRPGDAAAPVDAATADAIFRDVELATLEAVADRLQAATAHLAGIESVFETHAGSRGPDFSPLLALIHQCSVSLKPRLQARRAAEAGASSELESGPPEAEPAASRSTSGRGLEGEIGSRADVLRALEKICAYYERHEPSSPLPLLLQRCKRLVPLGFMEIVRDLAPDALSQLELIAGKAAE